MPDLRAVKSPRAAAAPQQVPAAAWDLRMLRALPFATVCTLAAAAGHAVVAHESVPVWALAVGFAAVWTLATVLGGRERSLPAIAAALAVGQLSLHVLFHLAEAAGGGTMAGMDMSSGSGTSVTEAAGRLLCGLHQAGGVPLLPTGTNAQQLLLQAGLNPAAYQAQAPTAPCWHDGFLGLSPQMLAGHLVAALVAGWWLRRGEAALWRLLRLTAAAAQQYTLPLRTVLAVAIALLHGQPGAPRRPAGTYGGDRGDWRLPGSATLRHFLVRRGPPVAALAI